jgi:LPXTG-site transpeptidase (sortase) family protein
MDPDDKKHDDQFDASLPLPEEATANKKSASKDPAVDLIRKKVTAAYTDEPDAEEEIKEVEDLKKGAHHSKHQQFIYELTNSGRPLHEVQVAWHEYYAGLPDKEKHAVWQEFYQTHSKKSEFTQAAHESTQGLEEKAIVRNAKRHHTARKAPAHRKLSAPIAHHSKQYLKSLGFGLSVGAFVLVVFLFGFFNERIIAPFIQPSRNVTGTPIISDSTVSSASEVIIPKINVEIPVVYDINTIDETAIEKGLESGVVHYADTALPGQNGNAVVVGHSSNNILNKGKYKFAFVLLNRMQIGDTFYLQKDGKRYTYQIYERKVVEPTDVSILAPTDKPATATLVTCDPPGTSLHRLVVIGQQISPDPSSNIASATQNTLATSAQLLPGNSPTLWSRMVKWFEQ